MEKKIIIQKAQRLSSVGDLVVLLNTLKKEEYGEKSFPITVETIKYYLHLNKSKRFIEFSIPKKKGSYRKISAPKEGLSDILHFLNRIFQAMYRPHENVMGFIEKRSVVDNAKRHLNQNYVYNIDLKDFFPSVEEKRVFQKLQEKPYCIKRCIASKIANLCCIRTADKNGELKTVLPQGAPTSPTLTNMICEELDYKLNNLAKKFCLNFTRYADDITFSSMHNVYQDNSKFINNLKSIIEEQGFRINERKTRLKKKGSRQEVTGLKVNCKTNVSKKYVKQIRILLHIWKEYGYVAAQTYFYPNYKLEKPHKNGEPLIENVISGKLMYMKMVKGENDPTYIKLKERFDELMAVPGLKNRGQQERNNLTYFVSYSLPDFETHFGINLRIKEIIPSWNGGAHITFNLKSEARKWPIIISSSLLKAIFLPASSFVSHSDLEYLFSLKIQLQDNSGFGSRDDERIKNIKTIINSSYNKTIKDYKIKFSKDKNLLYISLCGGLYKGKISRFWLITKMRPKYVLSDAKKLNLDELLKIWQTEGLSKVSSIYGRNMSRFFNINTTSLPNENSIDNIESFLNIWEKEDLDTAADAFCQ